MPPSCGQLQTCANQITEAQVDAAAQEVEVEAAIDDERSRRSERCKTSRRPRDRRPSALPRKRRASGSTTVRSHSASRRESMWEIFLSRFPGYESLAPGRGRRAAQLAMTWVVHDQSSVASESLWKSRPAMESFPA